MQKKIKNKGEIIKGNSDRGGKGEKKVGKMVKLVKCDRNYRETRETVTSPQNHLELSLISVGHSVSQHTSQIAKRPSPLSQ